MNLPAINTIFALRSVAEFLHAYTLVIYHNSEPFRNQIMKHANHSIQILRTFIPRVHCSICFSYFEYLGSCKYDSNDSLIRAVP
uniref:Uncharacterized protein n=1 Tax=Lotus japonicus TaxID=34305 RepID=I3S6A9_LOTJA|nr:unknown [Lotus japonicus]